MKKWNIELKWVKSVLLHCNRKTTLSQHKNQTKSVKIRQAKKIYRSLRSLCYLLVVDFSVFLLIPILFHTKCGRIDFMFTTLFYHIWLVKTFQIVLVRSFRFNPMQRSFCLESIHLVRPEIFSMRNANIGYHNQNIIEQMTLLMRKCLIKKKPPERKVVKKEGGGTKQKLLNRHSGKLKQWIWNAAVTWKFATAKFNLLLPLQRVVSVT